MTNQPKNSCTRRLSMRHVSLLALATLWLGSLPGAARAQVLVPLPTVAGVPFYPNVFGAHATEAAAAKGAGNSASPRAAPGMPRDVYIGHASVVMWVDDQGEARYSAAVALHSVTFTMTMLECRKQNGGDGAKCKEVYDARTPVLAVTKSSDGGYFFTKGASKSEARKAGMEACEKRANVSCTTDKVYGSGGGFFE
jgi:hypothetical protein